jgi:hypothetical protein
MPSFTSAVKIVTGERIAKSSCGYLPQVRAEDAARWLRGEVVVRPTTKMACAVFGISYPRLRQAQKRLARLERSKHHINGNGSAVLPDAVIDGIVAEVGHDRIFAALDRVTAPELPLAAAE